MTTTIQVDNQGNVTVDGKTITPQQFASLASDVPMVVKQLESKFSWTNVEHAALYLVSVVGATNVFGTVHLGTLRYVLPSAAAFIIGSLHLGGKKA